MPRICGGGFALRKGLFDVLRARKRCMMARDEDAQGTFDPYLHFVALPEGQQQEEFFNDR
jgi:hypothetical protein